MEIKSIAEVLDMLKSIQEYIYKTTKPPAVLHDPRVTPLDIQFTVNKGIIFHGKMLYMGQGSWLVDVARSPMYTACSLTPIARNYLKPGDVAYMTSDADADFEDLDDYYIILNETEAACWCKSGEVHIVNCSFEYYYKVEIV